MLSSACIAAAKEPLQFGDVSAQPTDTGARILFSWNTNSTVAFTPEVHGNKVLLKFESPVALEWDKALDTLNPYLKEVATTNGGKTVVLTLNSSAQARKFLMYSRKGVDFAKNGVELTAPNAMTMAQQAPSLPTPVLVAMDVIKKPTAAEKKIAAKKAKQQLIAKNAARRKTELARAKTTTKPETVASDAAALAGLSPAAGEHTPPAAEAPKAAEAKLEPPAHATETKPEPAKEAAAEKPAAEQPAAPPDQTEIIALPLLSDDPIAIILHGKTVWLAAPESAKLTEEVFRKENPSFKHSLQTIPAKQGTVLSIALDDFNDAEAVKLPDGKLQLTLSKNERKPQEILSASLTTQENKTALAIEVPKSGKLITASDAATGQTIHILPTTELGSGVDIVRTLVEFSLLPTAQGVAVQQMADNLQVTQTKDTLEVTTPKGLAVSAEMRQTLEDAKTGVAAGKIPPVFYPYEVWKLDDEKKFVSTQMKLMHASLNDKPEVANQARLRLLNLFLAEGMFAEANGMANDILRNSYKFYVEHKVASMRAAANFMRYRFAEAEQDFESPELEGLPETKMWLALCADLLDKGKNDFNFKTSYESYIRYYPPSFIQKLAIIAADKYIARKQYDDATAVFTALQKENLDEPIKKYIDFMRAKILAETGNDDEAGKIWERQASDITDRFFRARAEFSLVNMYLKEDKIPVEDAAKRLEKLRIVWRGDTLELNVLTLLGSLYVEKKDFARALRAWRDIVAYYPDVPEAITTAQKMEEVFVKLYNKSGADTMPALDALSLYYEFRDLVPTGAEGDLMIRNLAERLVKIDLLDRASQLLSHQIRNRLQGTERSRVGTRLAEIYLMNRQPKQALEILKTTGYGELPPDILLARTRLTAQALAQQGQLSKAIEVLSSDTSAEGNLLRLNVYWTNWDWPNVVAMAEEILSNRNDPSAALTLPESEVLLKLATAYVYEHDSGQIQYLRDYFTPLLKGNPNRDSFMFITSESGSIDYGNLSNLDIDIRTVKSFIDNSRKEATAKSASSQPAPGAEPVPKKAVN